MDKGREADKKLLMKMSKEKLIELFFMQMRNLWAMDGLYYLGIEQRFGTEEATKIDMRIWEIMGKIEARRIKETFGLEDDNVQTIMEALKLTSWSLDLEDKEIIVEEDRGVFRNTKCRVQKTRIKKGLPEFPCKNVRWGYLKNFAQEFNKNMVVECNVCPPDKHKEDLWCEWEFKIKK